MPIILAIEPDRLQAASLAAAVRRRVGAELILADTTEGALDAIGDRVPDMVLVPALLAPQDDAALAAALRVIAAATHVRTLTIPVLSSGHSKPAAQEGLMSRWRRAKTTPASEGCEPDVFADQIAAYLREAAAEREALEPLEPETIEPIASGFFVVEPAAIETAEAGQPDPHDLPDLPAPPEPVVVDALDLDLSDEIAALAAEPDDTPAVEEFAGEPVGVYTMPSLDEPVVEEAVVEEIVVEETVVEEPTVQEPPVQEPTPVELAAAEPAAEAVAPVVDPVLDEFFEAFAPEPRVAVVAPMLLSMERLWPPMEGVPIEMPAAERTEWSALVASLRQDIEQRAARPAQPAAKSATRTQTPKKRQKPVQDEWGFFDPEQCGFSALLAKLDEITADSAGT